jgi:hypothetical protein
MLNTETMCEKKIKRRLGEKQLRAVLNSAFSALVSGNSLIMSYRLDEAWTAGSEQRLCLLFAWASKEHN